MGMVLCAEQHKTGDERDVVRKGSARGGEGVCRWELQRSEERSVCPR